MAIFAHHETIPSPPPPPTVYRDIYAGSFRRADGPEATPLREEVVAAFNASPIDLGGVLVCPYTNRQGTKTVAFTRHQSADGSTRLPADRDLRIYVDMSSEGEGQGQAQRRVELPESRTARQRRASVLGKLGQLGVAGIGGVEAMADLGNGVLVTTLGGGAVAAAGYGIARLGINAHRRRRTVKALNRFTNWATRPDNGAILFTHASAMSSSKNIAQKGIPAELTESQAELVTWARESGIKQAAIHTIGEKLEGHTYIVSPHVLVTGLLRRAPNAGVVWDDGLDDHIQTLAQTEQKLLAKEALLANAKERKYSTGEPLYADRPIDDEITGLNIEVKTIADQLLATSLAMIELCKRHVDDHDEAERLTRVEVLIDELATNNDEGADPSIRTALLDLRSVACQYLVQIDPARADSETILNDLAQYLNEARRLMVNPAQVEAELDQFYRGMRKQFGARVGGVVFPPLDRPQ